jgi:hypothetical protein
MCLLSPAAIAQPHSCEFWITVSDSDSPSTTNTRHFGEYLGATYGEDGQINYTLVEETIPPPGPGFITLWVDIPSRAAWYQLGSGILPDNFQGFPTNTLKCDTFNIVFVDYTRPQADFTFRWPGHDYLAARCDSMFFFYGYSVTDSNGNRKVVRIRIDMFKQDSAVITRPQDLTLYDSKVTNALIIKYGANMIDEVGAKSPSAPSEFSLRQNYPNPFNPSTTIEFELPMQSSVTLKVFNIFGEEVATLAGNRSFSAGEHSVTLNATNLGSGIYFYQINARSNEGKYFQQVKKMVLLK